MKTIDSFLGEKWHKKNLDERESLLISQRHEISLILSNLLSLRDLKEGEIENYLFPDLLQNLPDPNNFIDMNKSLERTYKAIQNSEKIAIIADYDVDGSTSAAIMHKFFKEINIEVLLEIPNRLDEGYGPNKKIMNKLKNQNTNLLFTLDCGTNSFEVLNDKEYKNIDIIVIDHHISDVKLPEVYSLINPNRFDETGESKDLAAVGVTFIFLMALRRFLREKNYFIKKNFPEPNLLNLLDLVALGTVCDVVKLKNYNRAIVKKGMDIIHKRKNESIKKLFDNSNINREPNVQDLSFIIGPQLNAASRIENQFLATKILITEDITEIENLTKRLFLLNEKRKLIEKNIYEEALEQASKQLQNNIILVSGNNWHKGVLGIVAGKISEKYYKPCIVISFVNEIGYGSARSIKDFNLGKLIIEANNDNLLISGGGHEQAAGLKINKLKLDMFFEYLINRTKTLDPTFFRKTNYYDLDLSIDQINFDLIENIEKMEPFGNGNEEPRFKIINASIEHVKIVKEKHLMIFIKNNFNNNLKGICFNCVDNNLGQNLLNFKSKKFHIFCSLKRDNFNDKFMPQIIIYDAILSIN